MGSPNHALHRTRAKAARASERGRWAGEKTEFPRILLEEFRFDQVEDLAGCIAGGRTDTVDSEVRIDRRFVGRLESW